MGLLENLGVQLGLTGYPDWTALSTVGLSYLSQ